MQRGKLVVIDGMDGSGKGTQLARLRGPLSDLDVIYSREPGGTPSAEFIRDLLLNPKKYDFTSHPLCDFFLFFASRALHIEQKVEPSRVNGVHVITDRYDSSTLAFQLYGERQDYRQLFIEVRKALPAYFLPDAYIILDLPPEVAYQRRARDSSQEKSRFDEKPLEYHRQVREGFKMLASMVEKGETVHMIDANRSVEEVHQELVVLVRSILIA